MLSLLAGRTHEVVTGVCLLQACPSRQELFTVATEVIFKPLREAQIRAYMELVPVLDKAGSYAIQDHGEMLVEAVNGSLTNVIGLPVERLAEAFLRWQVITRLELDRIVERPRRSGLEI